MRASRGKGANRFRRRQLRRTGRPPVRARDLLARQASRPMVWRTSSSSPAPGRGSTPNACWLTRSASARRRSPSGTATRNPKPPFERYVFMLQRGRRRLWRARASRQHRADRAGGVTCRRKDVTALTEGYVGAARPDLARVLPHLERQAPEAGAVLSGAGLPRARTTTELLWFFEGFTSYYDDLLLQARRADRRAALPGRWLAKTINGVAATPGRAGAERRRNRASTPGPSTTAATRTRPTRR